jgi:hypothetical protein
LIAMLKDHGCPSQIIRGARALGVSVLLLIEEHQVQGHAQCLYVELTAVISAAHGVCHETENSRVVLQRDARTWRLDLLGSALAELDLAAVKSHTTYMPMGSLCAMPNIMA